MSSSWVDIDWSDNHVPTEDEIEQSLRHLQFRPVPIEADAVIRLVDTFSTMLTNGGAYAAAFDVADSDDVAAWLISRNRDEYTLADTLVRSSAFAEAMPEVAGTGPLDPTDFERSSALTLDGDLARKLQWGGAYTDPSMPGAQAKALGATSVLTSSATGTTTLTSITPGLGGQPGSKASPGMRPGLSRTDDTNTSRFSASPTPTNRRPIGPLSHRTAVDRDVLYAHYPPPDIRRPVGHCTDDRLAPTAAGEESPCGGGV